MCASAVRVAQHRGEMWDGVGVMVCSVVSGIGGVLRHLVRGPMGLRFGGYVLEVWVVPVEVGHLEGRQVRSAVVYCRDVDLAISVLVPLGLLFHDVKLDVGGKAAKGFPEQQCLGAEACRGGFVEWLSCYAEEQVCVDSGVHYEPDPDDVREVVGYLGRDFGDGVGYGPQLPVGGGPVGGVAPVVVHVVVSPGVGQLQGGPPANGREGGFA